MCKMHNYFGYLELGCIAVAMTHLIADKCLAPYYGGCDTTRGCVSSRDGVFCGGCLPGFMEISDESGEKFCGSKFMP